MQTFIDTFPISKETGKIMLQVCKKHNIRHEKEIVDIYRHKPDPKQPIHAKRFCDFF